MRPEGFWSKKMEHMICSVKRPLMGGSWDIAGKRSGSAWAHVGMNCPWAFKREIRNGYWVGQMVRVREDDPALQ